MTDNPVEASQGKIMRTHSSKGIATYLYRNVSNISWSSIWFDPVDPVAKLVDVVVTAAFANNTMGTSVHMTTTDISTGKKLIDKHTHTRSQIDFGETYFLPLKW